MVVFQEVRYLVYRAGVLKSHISSTGWGTCHEHREHEWYEQWYGGEWQR